MIAASATHLVLIPSYNPGAKVYETVRTARQFWNPVWVVVDGSDDGSAEGLLAMAAKDNGLRVMVLSRNQGKGSAVLSAGTACGSPPRTPRRTRPIAR
ncbi:MAG: glycosyltransferase [Sulfuriferula sp.]